MTVRKNHRPHQPKSGQRKTGMSPRLAVTLSLVGLMALGITDFNFASAATPTQDSQRSSRRIAPEANPPLDRTGRKRVGKASFYAKMFAGRTMADGTRMEPTGNNAPSRTLPLGTTAKVTNLETGKSAVVTIRDRGPYVVGRIVGLSPATAQEIGLEPRQGVTKVTVSPITVPLPDGQVKLGAAILEAKLEAGNNLEASNNR
jgi:rare lipoprotein A